MRRPDIAGGVVGGVDWSRWSVVLLKPDCVRRDLCDTVLQRIATGADVEISAHEIVTVADWQIHVHYWDLLVDADWFAPLDVPAALRASWIGQRAGIALARGTHGDTTARIRALLGHYDPAVADPYSIRGALGVDSEDKARAEGRLIENLVHTSDDPAATCRDFGTWYGAARHDLLQDLNRTHDEVETLS